MNEIEPVQNRRDAESSRDPLLLDHEVDGIQELDNLLPRWWVWLFYLTIFFSAAYLLYYHVLGIGDLQSAEYEKERKRGEEIKSASIAKFEASVGTLQPSKEPAILSQGIQTYTTYCAPCHRPDGGGLVGPNLCDDYWIHGATFVDNLKIILNGVPEKGMLTWRGVLKPSEVHAVASYIYTFRGTQPPNPKPPENQQQPEKPNEFE
ncbi:MAG: cbb3-type cytochrome c oxidase N-terminal domain-containing protein [Verrucomicrobiota bacterium]|jgi:cytochrome c oxidase cbb3-type subunit III